MAILDTKLTVGQSAQFDRALFNELVDRLSIQEVRGPIRVEASASRVEVHHTDGSVKPGAVYLRDATRWADVPDGWVELEWTLTGPGELNGAGSAVTTGPGETVTWTWAAADWDATPGGLALPQAAEIDVVVKSRTTTGGAHQVIDAHTRTSFIVGRAYDPDRPARVSPRLSPDRELAPLGPDGTTQIQIQDHTTIPDAASSALRTVTAAFDGAEAGEGVTLSSPAGLSGAEMIGAGDASVAVTPARPGRLTVTATYDVDEGGTTTTYETQRQFTVLPEPPGQLGASAAPVRPSIAVTPGDGQTHFELGSSVTIESLSDEGPLFSETSPTSFSETALQEMASRLDLDGLQAADLTSRSGKITLSGPAAQELAKAGHALTSILTRETDFGLRKYLVTAAREDGGLLEGRTIRAGAARLRVTGTRADGRLEAVGYAPEGLTFPLEGFVLGSGDRLSVETQFRFGTPGESDFDPLAEHFDTRLLDPEADSRRFSIALSRAVPESMTDTWHVRYRLTARWSSGGADRGTWSDWAPAETRPAGAPRLVLDDTADGQVTARLDGARHDFYGTARWVPAGETPSGDPAPNLNAGVFTGLVGSPPPSHSGGSALVTEGHYRARGGTPAGPFRASSAAVTPPGAAVITKDPATFTFATDAPAAPPTNGTILKAGSRMWISAGGSWAQVSAGATSGGILLENVDLVRNASGSTFNVSTSQASASKWTASFDFSSAESVDITFMFNDVVESTELVDSPVGQLTMNETNATISFSMADAYAGDVLRFVVRAVSAEGDRVFEFELADETLDQAPEIYHVDAEGKNGTLAERANITLTSQQWDVTHSTGPGDDWAGSGTILTLFVNDVASVDSVTSADSPGFSYSVFDNKRPPHIVIIGDGTASTFSIDMTSPAGVTKTYTVHLTDSSV